MPKPQSLLDSFTEERKLELHFEVLAKKDYSFYLEYAHDGLYKHARHTELIANRLQEIERLQALKIPSYTIFELPPRHGKSMSITETFPSWFIGRNPQRRVIATAYGQDLANRFGKRNKDKFEYYAPKLFDLVLDPTSRSVTDWDVQGHRGGMITRGMGGGITGQGADLLIIDDPFKNRQEAESETYRNRVWDEWESTLSTRLHKGAAVIVLMTRWHEDDLIGRMLAREPGKWQRVRLPAIAEENDILGREEGSSLWPEGGFDEKWAAEKKISVGSRTWESLYQQNPRPSEGSMFKRHYWKYYKQAPVMQTMVLSWDCTFKDSKDSDYVAGHVWGKVGADFYLLDRIKAKMNITATMQGIQNQAAKWPKAHAKLIEDKANGPAVIQLLKNKVPGLIPVNPEGGKVVRAAAAEPFVEAGNVYIPDPSIAPWINDFVEELAAFPNGKNDDDVDAFTQAIAYLNKPKGFFIG
jgi:predicted phage terminase large subunit-like protein